MAQGGRRGGGVILLVVYPVFYVLGAAMACLWLLEHLWRPVLRLLLRGC